MHNAQDGIVSRVPEHDVDGDRGERKVGAAVRQRATQVAARRLEAHGEQLQGAQAAGAAAVRAARAHVSQSSNRRLGQKRTELVEACASKGEDHGVTVLHTHW